MFLIDSRCLKAERRSTPPPLYHIRAAAVASLVEAIFGLNVVERRPLYHGRKACSCDRSERQLCTKYDESMVRLKMLMKLMTESWL